jgi:2-haloacid dehalogenase
VSTIISFKKRAFYYIFCHFWYRKFSGGTIMLDFAMFEVMTFDCYGTLIDWESGIASAMGKILTSHGVTLEGDEILELFAKIESRIEAGKFHNYKTVLAKVAEGFGQELGFIPHRSEIESFSLSVKDWPPFHDSVEALHLLKKRYRLAVISNVDDDLFAFSAKYLEADFDWVVTAEAVKSYKPSLNNFYHAIEKIGIPKERILHVAQSLYHDIEPAEKVGLKTVWINRRHDKEGFGATPAAKARPDMELADLTSLAASARR